MQTHKLIYGFLEGFTPYTIQRRLIRYKLALNILSMKILIIAAAEDIFDLYDMTEILCFRKNIKIIFLLTFCDDEASAHIILLHADLRYDDIIPRLDFQHDGKIIVPGAHHFVWKILFPFRLPPCLKGIIRGIQSHAIGSPALSQQMMIYQFSSNQLKTIIIIYSENVVITHSTFPSTRPHSPCSFSV